MALADGLASGGSDAAGGDAAGSLAQVLATGLTNLLKTGASRSVLCSL